MTIATTIFQNAITVSYNATTYDMLYVAACYHSEYDKKHVELGQPTIPVIADSSEPLHFQVTHTMNRIVIPLVNTIGV